ncbi:MAG: hypothetical protein DCC67_18005 [Planctomycetota bacterium]|nr:MAG: hypothetical protein DCC67_18005 [Planctomycetota bacterium]
MRSAKLGWLLVAIVAIAAAVWYRYSVMQEPQPRPMGSVVVVTGGPGPYWETIARGAQAAAKDLHVDVKVLNPQDDENVQQQTEILSKLDLNNVAGVAVSPLDAENQSPLIDKIAENAVVVTFDSDAPQSQRDVYIGTSNYAAGIHSAKLVREALPDGGKIIVLLANLTKNNMLERREGFETEIRKGASPGAPADERYQIVDFLIDEGDADRCRQAVTAALEANADVACIVGMNGYHGPLVRSLLKDSNRLGQIKLVMFDDEPETLAGVEAGDIYATVAQDPYLYGYRAVEWLSMVCRGREGLRPLNKSKSTFNVNVQIVRKDDVANYRDQVQQRSTQPPAS